MWSEQLGLWIGTAEGIYLQQRAVWLRFFTPEGQLVLSEAEREHQRVDEERQRAEEERQRAEEERQRADEERQRADEERQRAEEEHRRAEALAVEVSRLQALLKEKGITPETDT